MAKKISLDRLAGEIANAITEYTEDVSEAVAETIDKTAKELCKEVKATAPKKTGEYAKGFKVTDVSRGGSTKKIIWNKKHYRLVHLLEHGHAKVGGGRVEGKPHMGPAEEKYNKQLVSDIEDIIKNGGAR